MVEACGLAVVIVSAGASVEWAPDPYPAPGRPAMTTARNPQDVHPPVADSVHQIERRPGGPWLVLSGQIGTRPDGSLPPDPAEQITDALENVRRNLAAAEMDV